MWLLLYHPEIVLFFTWLTFADFGVFEEVQWLLGLVGGVLFIIFAVLAYVLIDQRDRIGFRN